MQLVCERCREDVGPEVRQCPHCGFDASERGRSRAKTLWWIGLVLCVTVVGAVAGVPLVLYAYYLSGKAETNRVGTEA